MADGAQDGVAAAPVVLLVESSFFVWRVKISPHDIPSQIVILIKTHIIFILCRLIDIKIHRQIEK
jgi:hypothetical protein